MWKRGYPRLLCVLLSAILLIGLWLLTGCASEAGSGKSSRTVTKRIIEVTATPSNPPSPTDTGEPSSLPPVATTTPLKSEETPYPTAKPTATTASSTATPQQKAKVIVANANVRAGPGTVYAVIGTAKQNDELPLIGQNTDGTWYNVRLPNGDLGWVGGSVAALASDEIQRSIPVVLTIPAAPTPAPSATNTPSIVAPTNTPLLVTNTPLSATEAPTLAPTVTTAPTATPEPPQPSNCDPSYPTVCIPPPPPDLDCGDIPHRRFTVLQPDPHRFDGDKDGIGCES